MLGDIKRWASLQKSSRNNLHSLSQLIPHGVITASLLSSLSLADKQLLKASIGIPHLWHWFGEHVCYTGKLYSEHLSVCLFVGNTYNTGTFICPLQGRKFNNTSVGSHLPIFSKQIWGRKHIHRADYHFTAGTQAMCL